VVKCCLSSKTKRFINMYSLPECNTIWKGYAATVEPELVPLLNFVQKQLLICRYMNTPKIMLLILQVVSVGNKSLEQLEDYVS